MVVAGSIDSGADGRRAAPETPSGKFLTCDTTGGLEGERLADLLVLLADWPELHTNQKTKRSPGLHHRSFGEN